MNKWCGIGRLTKDVEVKYTANNTAVASFTLAVNRKYKQQGQPEADFLNVVAWDKTASFCGQYFKKGQQVAIVGRIQTRSYDNNEGRKVYVMEIVAEEAHFADSKRQSKEEEGEEIPIDALSGTELPF